MENAPKEIYVAVPVGKIREAIEFLEQSRQPLVTFSDDVEAMRKEAKQYTNLKIWNADNVLREMLRGKKVELPEPSKQV